MIKQSEILSRSEVQFITDFFAIHLSFGVTYRAPVEDALSELYQTMETLNLYMQSMI
jgi:hypothetical protein